MMGFVSCALAMVIAGGVLYGESLPAPPQLEEPGKVPRKLWLVSVSEMFAGSSFDAWSSARLNPLVDKGLVHESNGLFSDARGHYVAGRAVPIECGIYAGIAVGEYLLMRKFPRLARPFSALNFGLSGIGLSHGLHNVALYNRTTRP